MEASVIARCPQRVPYSSCLFFLVFSTFLGIVTGDHASAAGGRVILRTDNSGESGFYSANGSARGRYCAYYEGGLFAEESTICGIRFLAYDLNRNPPTPTILSGDLRSEDANHLGYANISSTGLIALVDEASQTSCSTRGNYSTYTFGGGSGVPDPLTPFLLTLSQPATNSADGADFCGIRLDTTSAFANSARTQAYSLADNPLFASIGYNHFVEAIVFEPKEIDLALRVTGSSRFPGDRGLPVMFARRACNPSSNDCRAQAGDSPVSTSDDFITARIVLDNYTCSPRNLSLSLVAHRGPINPKLGPKEVSSLFRPCGGGPPIPTSFLLPAKSRWVACLEIRTILPRRVLDRLPANLPFIASTFDPNDPSAIESVDSASQLLGFRPIPGMYDDGSASGGFLYSRNPVRTGDALTVRFDALDLQNRSHQPLPYSIHGVQVLAGDFGGSNLAGLDAVELRLEDPVIPDTPDFSPSGLLGHRSTVGDPKNADGIRAGPPLSTINVDLTNIVITPGNATEARNLFAMAYLNPGDTSDLLTGIAATRRRDPFVGNSSARWNDRTALLPFLDDDLSIRLDIDGELTRIPSSRASGTRRQAPNRNIRAYGEIRLYKSDRSLVNP